MPKKCQKIAKNYQNLPKNVKKWPKYHQNIKKYRQVVQKLPFFGCIGVVLVLQEIFFMLYWSRVDFWPKNDSRIGLESDFSAKNDSRIGLESDFLAFFGQYWSCIGLTKITNAEL